ncbi:MAG: hypothetical protein KY464_18430, partial [Gemmatimonadetes bacterium]|nr:hypothetical protein [Gemmatimonadota bacterium]
SLQLRAYPVLVARQAEVPFNVPLLAKPGCPPPYSLPVFVDSVRVGGVPGRTCAFRQDTLRFTPIQNLAYPGSYLPGAIDNTVTANPPEADIYKTVILGGRTQVQAMIDARPTFVSVWLGNNEALVPALAGDVGLFARFPQAAMDAALDSIVRAIQRTPARTDALLIAPVNALSFTALIQPGTFLWVLEQDPSTRVLLRRAGKSVSNDCSPLARGANLVSLRETLSPGRPSVISRADAAPGVMAPAEVAAYGARLAEIKRAIKRRADANGWLYLDPDAELAGSLTDPARFRKCQGLATATLATLPQQVAATCPGPSAPNYFGSFVSLDGTHPSNDGHVAIANVIIARINAKYGLQIPRI